MVARGARAGQATKADGFGWFGDRVNMRPDRRRDRTTSAGAAAFLRDAPRPPTPDGEGSLTRHGDPTLSRSARRRRLQYEPAPARQAERDQLGLLGRIGEADDARRLRVLLTANGRRG